MSKWPNCDATQTRHVVPPTECIYHVSNWYLTACWRKVRKKRGRTVGQTDGHCHGIIRPFFKRAYKNGPWIPPCVWRNSDVVIPKLYKRKMVDSMPWAIMYGYSWPHNSNSTYCFIIWHYYNSPMLSKHINCSGMFWHYHFSMIWWQLEDIVTHYEC